jgi:RNA polymerase sigma factor (sigma-70 family)
MTDEMSAHLLARWRQGDEAAAEALFRRYAERLNGLVRLRLSEKLARRLDPEDVVQSVYRSFFTGAREGRYAVGQSGELWRLLVIMAKHKLGHQIEYHTAAKRTLDREDPDVTLRGLDAEGLAAGPSPDEATAVADELEQIMRALDPSQRQIFELRLQGYTLEEVAAETGRSFRTVRRILERVKDYLEQRYRHAGGLFPGSPPP